MNTNTTCIDEIDFEKDYVKGYLSMEPPTLPTPTLSYIPKIISSQSNIHLKHSAIEDIISGAYEAYISMEELFVVNQV